MNKAEFKKIVSETLKSQDFAYENKWKKKCTEGKILFL
ncbi:hypothetical protein HMPREF1150_1596 [Streptococcus sp. AS14]|jgi:hypothetical protein|uniref:Uncharacterized protein n=1 Tax=Streptococcus sanguinis TaxID=1305 RepID=A0AAE8FYE6_STRSA|nr:hypothetical protein HMPREF1150_1596 [Streptococcus sp. AS14]MCC3166536.1 hypothetical protein [Streptococcus sanguinis]RSI01656.1 hypothetical protein D8890_11440 [Streptococcus sanguinis]RSI08518.1 hypothetical protein D8888_05825 [Streptococcus sanguinis]RSI36428.1 hypothetical protein D8876_01970 [Streptococcus sanguinis]